jgi:hypothetical protein
VLGFIASLSAIVFSVTCVLRPNRRSRFPGRPLLRRT